MQLEAGFDMDPDPWEELLADRPRVWPRPPETILPLDLLTMGEESSRCRVAGRAYGDVIVGGSCGKVKQRRERLNVEVRTFDVFDAANEKCAAFDRYRSAVGKGSSGKRRSLWRQVVVQHCRALDCTIGAGVRRTEACCAIPSMKRLEENDEWTSRLQRKVARGQQAVARDCQSANFFALEDDEGR